MLEKIKKLLDIDPSDTSHDEKLQTLIDAVLSEYFILQHDERIEIFFAKKFSKYLIPISFPFVTKVLEINGKALTNDDYTILDS